LNSGARADTIHRHPYSLSKGSIHIHELSTFIEQHSRLVVITGAGVSVASGIPTYRDNTGTWARNEPIQHRDFLQRHSSRQRYWARSFAGWPAVQTAKPNSAHYALAQLERQEQIALLVTQNVDRLHQRAGHRRVVDLHGRLDQVVCMDCSARTLRADIQERLVPLNPQLQVTGALAPDGDADVADELIANVVIPDCIHCGGILKPDVVFFGDSVNREIVATVKQAIEQADGLLVVGSSLMVYSGFRFCRHAAAAGTPIACINPGVTRADELFTLKISAPCGPVLQALIGA